jgi:hypothetical protein
MLVFAYVDLTGRLGRQTWPADLTGNLDCRLGRSDLLKLKMGVKIESQHCFMLKQIKNQRALLELLDLSDIAVGNVGVPTCFLGGSKSVKK